MRASLSTPAQRKYSRVIVHRECVWCVIKCSMGKCHCAKEHSCAMRVKYVSICAISHTGRSNIWLKYVIGMMISIDMRALLQVIHFQQVAPAPFFQLSILMMLSHSPRYHTIIMIAIIMISYATHSRARAGIFHRQKWIIGRAQRDTTEESALSAARKNLKRHKEVNDAWTWS